MPGGAGDFRKCTRKLRWRSAAEVRVAVDHLQEVDAVESGEAPNGVAPALIAAEVDHGCPPGCVNCATCFLQIAANHVLDGDSEDLVATVDLHRLDLNQVAQPLLQRALDQKLGGSGQLVAVGCEQQLLQAGAKARSIDPLSGRGEQHLLDQVADVVIGVRPGRPPAAVQVKRIVDVHHMPLTRTCVTTMFKPVPFGAQTAWLSCNRIGAPPASTRVAAVTH